MKRVSACLVFAATIIGTSAGAGDIGDGGFSRGEPIITFGTLLRTPTTSPSFTIGAVTVSNTGPRSARPVGDFCASGPELEDSGGSSDIALDCETRSLPAGLEIGPFSGSVSHEISFFDLLGAKLGVDADSDGFNVALAFSGFERSSGISRATIQDVGSHKIIGLIDTVRFVGPVAPRPLPAAGGTLHAALGGLSALHQEPWVIEIYPRSNTCQNGNPQARTV